MIYGACRKADEKKTVTLPQRQEVRVTASTSLLKV